MNEQTVSATYNVEQIDELIAEPVYFSELRPHVQLIVETATISLDPNHRMFWIVMPDREEDSQLKAEFGAWEAASDDDLAHFENNL